MVFSPEEPSDESEDRLRQIFIASLDNFIDAVKLARDREKGLLG